MPATELTVELKATGLAKGTATIVSELAFAVKLRAPTGVVETLCAKREVADSPAAAINERRSAEPERGEWGRFIRFRLN